MLNRIFVVDSVTLTSTGTAVSSYTPWDQTTRKLPTQVVIKATGQGAYVRLSNDASAATNADVLVQAGDHVVLSVQGRRWVSVLSDGASSTVNVGALSTGVSGSAASLDLAFVDAGVLDPRVTFTRASTATYFNSAGVLTSAAINESRRDFDPVTLAAQGLLIEEARTNSLQRSEEFNDAYWTKGNSSVTANATTSPSNTLTGDKLVEDTANNTHRVAATNISVTSGTAYTLSVFAKAAERSAIELAFGADASAFPLTIAIFSLIGAGSITNVAGTPNAVITRVGNGWYRCTISATASTTTASAIIRYFLCNGTTAGSDTYLGDGTSGLFIWGAQLEAGAFPTSYIPTTTTALTRSADVASVNTLSPWFNASAGTLYAEAQIAAGIGAAPAVMAGIDDTTINNRIQLRRQSPGIFGDGRFVSSGGNWTGTVTSGTLTGLNKQAVAYTASDQAGAVNGTLMTGIVSVATLPTITRLALGDGQGSTPLNGWLRRVVFYPRRLSNAELQAITA